MSLTIERHENRCLVRLDGQITLASAEELRALLLQGLASGNILELNLERTESLDIAGMQLLWAAGREAARAGTRIVVRSSEAARVAIRDAGFEQMLGLPVQE